MNRSNVLLGSEKYVNVTDELRFYEEKYDEIMKKYKSLKIENDLLKEQEKTLQNEKVFLENYNNKLSYIIRTNRIFENYNQSRKLNMEKLLLDDTHLP